MAGVAHQSDSALQREIEGLIITGLAEELGVALAGSSSFLAVHELRSTP